MTRFVVIRLVTAASLLLVLSTVTFIVYATTPADPAGFLLDIQHAKPGQIAAAHQALGLDHSYTYRYLVYMWNLLHGDFGTAWSTLLVGYDGQIHGEAVTHMVWQAAGQTGSVILGGAIVLALFAVPLA